MFKAGPSSQVGLPGPGRGRGEVGLGRGRARQGWLGDVRRRRELDPVGRPRLRPGRPAGCLPAVVRSTHGPHAGEGDTAERRRGKEPRAGLVDAGQETFRDGDGGPDAQPWALPHLAPATAAGGRSVASGEAGTLRRGLSRHARLLQPGQVQAARAGVHVTMVGV